MEILMKIWEWFNGNKTKLGTLMITLNVSQLYPEHTAIYIVFAYLGPLLAGVGVIHMAKKAISNTGAKA